MREQDSSSDGAISTALGASQYLHHNRKLPPGNGARKNVFMGAAENVLIKNKGSLRKYYDKMRADGIAHREAKKNLARKIAAVSLALMKTKKVYQEEHLATNSKNEKRV